MCQALVEAEAEVEVEVGVEVGVGVDVWVFSNGTVKFWRERAAFQLSAFGRSTAGNDVVATIFIPLFLFFFFPVFFSVFFPFFFLRRDLFS